MDDPHHRSRAPSVAVAIPFEIVGLNRNTVE